MLTTIKRATKVRIHPDISSELKVFFFLLIVSYSGYTKTKQIFVFFRKQTKSFYNF